MNTEFDEFVETDEFFNTVELVCKKTDFKPLSDTPIEPVNTGIEENEYTDRNDNIEFLPINCLHCFYSQTLEIGIFSRLNALRSNFIV